MTKFVDLPSTSSLVSAIAVHGASANHDDYLADGQWDDSTWMGDVQLCGAQVEGRLDDLEGVWTEEAATILATTTNPTMGSGGNVCAAREWIVQNGVCHATYMFRFGTSGTNAGSGFWYVALPVKAANSLGTGVAKKIGHASMGHAFSHTEGSVHLTDGVGSGLPADQQHAYFVPGAYASTPQGSILVTDSIPFAWSSSDNLHLSLMYRVDGF